MLLCKVTRDYLEIKLEIKNNQSLVRVLCKFQCVKKVPTESTEIAIDSI